MLDEVHLDVEVLRHRHLAPGGVLHGFGGGGLDALHGLVRVDGGHAVAAPLVDRHGGDGGDQFAGEIAQRLVAGDERHGHIVVAGGVGVEQELAARRAVEGHVVVFQVHRVAEGVAGAARPGVIAGEEHGVERLLIQPRHHRERVAGPGAVDARPARQHGGVDVAGGIVRVLDQHVLRAGGERAAAGGGHFAAHLLLVGGVVHGRGALRLRPGDDAASALHVGAQKYLHCLSSFR